MTQEVEQNTTQHLTECEVESENLRQTGIVFRSPRLPLLYGITCLSPLKNIWYSWKILAEKKCRVDLRNTGLIQKQTKASECTNCLTMQLQMNNLLTLSKIVGEKKSPPARNKRETNVQAAEHQTRENKGRLPPRFWSRPKLSYDQTIQTEMTSD